MNILIAIGGREYSKLTLDLGIRSKPALQLHMLGKRLVNSLKKMSVLFIKVLMKDNYTDLESEHLNGHMTF